MSAYSVEEEIEMLSRSTLTDREAEAYVLRRLEQEPGFLVAEKMGVSFRTVSNLVSTADEKIAKARHATRTLEDIRKLNQASNSRGAVGQSD